MTSRYESAPRGANEARDQDAGNVRRNSEAHFRANTLRQVFARKRAGIRFRYSYALDDVFGLAPRRRFRWAVRQRLASIRRHGRILMLRRCRLDARLI
jgi:hypothetical protein